MVSGIWALKGRFPGVDINSWYEERTAPWKLGELGRFECHKDFAFGQTWNGVLYATKRVRPIFVEESKGLVVVTVYTYYF